jgi:hypothetical protein
MENIFEKPVFLPNAMSWYGKKRKIGFRFLLKTSGIFGHRRPRFLPVAVSIEPTFSPQVSISAQPYPSPFCHLLA